MSFLSALADKGNRVAAHRPWPRVVIDADVWRQTALGVAAGEATLLGLWSDGDAVHLALIAEHLIDDDGLYGAAVLLREEGARMARELALIIGLKPAPPRSAGPELDQLAERLKTSGYGLRADPNYLAMAKQRADYMSCVDALAEHLGRPSAVLIRQN